MERGGFWAGFWAAEFQLWGIASVLLVVIWVLEALGLMPL